MERGTEESPLKILLLGPGGAGKSAVAVQVLCQWGGLGPRMMQTLQRQMEQKDRMPAQLLAFLQGGQERLPDSRGRKRHYESPRYTISITNAPGGSAFLSKSQHVCVLLISAAGGEFEAGWGLLKQQASFACRLRLRQLVVCVNKMDATDPPYNGRRYKSIVREVSVHLWGMGRNPNYVVFLPISALRGDNMQGASLEMPWFQGWQIVEEAGAAFRGMTLQQLLDAVALKHKPDSYYTVGVWSPQEEKSLLLAWKALASPASSGPPCPHGLSAALVRAGIRRSPEQCRSKANCMMNRYLAARLQGRRRTSPFRAELQAILDYEAAQFMLQLENMKPQLQGLTRGSAPLEEEWVATAGPSRHRELLLAGEVLGMEKGPGVCSESPQRRPEGRGEPPALPECLGPPSGQREQDPDCLLTGLEIKRCERTAGQPGGQMEQGTEAAASLGVCRCVVSRRAYFAVKQKQVEPATRPPPEPDMPEPLLVGPPLHPPEAPCPPLLPVPEVYQLLPYPWHPEPPPPPASLVLWGHPPPLQLPLSLAQPLLQVGSPCLPFPAAHPGPAVQLLHFPQVSPCYAPSGPAHALPWQYQQARASAPWEHVGHRPSSQPVPEAPCDQAPPGDEPSPAPPGPPDTAVTTAATLLLPVSPQPCLLLPAPASLWEGPQGPCEAPSAASPESLSSGTSMSPLLAEAPQGSCLGLSATLLLSSLAQLAPGEDLEVVCPPGTPVQPLSPSLSADSGAPPSPQPQCLLSSGLPSPPWPPLCRGGSSQWQLPSSLQSTLPPSSLPGSPKASSSMSRFLN